MHSDCEISNRCRDQRPLPSQNWICIAVAATQGKIQVFALDLLPVSVKFSGLVEKREKIYLTNFIDPA